MLVPELITRIRRRMGKPLPQSPSPKEITDRAIAFYRNATMQANNTGNAWATQEFTLTTDASVRRYEITVPDFSKALLVCTVPSSEPGVTQPELPLEFTQLEQLPNDWAFLNDTGWYWSLWWGTVSQRARYSAFYRMVDGSAGFKNFMEIRPTPIADEQYRILYQVGDWSQSMESNLNFKFPFPELDYYFEALTANSLLSVARWSNDPAYNDAEYKRLSFGLVQDLALYKPTWDAYVASLSVTDIVYCDSFSDFMGI